MLDAKATDSIAAIYEFARMTEEQQNQHLINLEIRNLEAEVKDCARRIARQRKHIRELISAGITVTADTQENLQNILAAQNKAQTHLEELRA